MNNVPPTGYQGTTSLGRCQQFQEADLIPLSFTTRHLLIKSELHFYLLYHYSEHETFSETWPKRILVLALDRLWHQMTPYEEKTVLGTFSKIKINVTQNY